MDGPSPVGAAMDRNWRSSPAHPNAATLSQADEGHAALRRFHLDRRLQIDKPGTPDVILSSQGGEHMRNTRSFGAATEAQRDTRRFSGLRSLWTKVVPGASDAPTVTPSRDAEPPRRAPLAKLVMPSARKAALPMLNEDSPPLSPVLDESSSERELETPANDAASITSERPHHAARRHAWSAAQAAADAAAHAESDPLHGVKPVEPWPRLAEPLPLPVLNDRSSPPSSLSSAPSLTWSSNEDEKKSSSPVSFPGAFLSQIYRASAARILPQPCAQRADVDPATQPFSLAVLAPHAWRLALLALTFVLATAFLGLCLGTLPLHLPTHLAQLTLAEVRDMCAGLKEYARSSNWARLHVWVVLSIFFTWKQAFCVPGSLITNIVFGAMYGAYAGSFFASILTAFGGVLCYLLAMPFGEVVALVPGISKPLHTMRKALDVQPDARLSDGDAVRIALERPSGSERRSAAYGMRKNLWNYLLFLRLLPVVPYGMMNIACGVLCVPLLPYAVTLAIGSIPWNFCTAQIGEILQDVVSAIQANHAHVPVSNAMPAGSLESSTTAGGAADSLLASGTLSVLLDRIWTVDMMVKLVLLSVASALPVVVHRLFARETVEEAAALEEGS